MATDARPEILLLSLEFQSFFDKTYVSLIDGLYKSAQVKRAKGASGALRYLESNSPKAIIATDQGLTKREHGVVLAKVKEYVTNGGLVLIGLHFPNFTNGKDWENLFKKGFGLSWEQGSYHRTTFRFNPASTTLPASILPASLPEPYSMKVLQVNHARPDEKIYIPIDGAKTQSHVFPPNYVNQSEAAAVCAKIGDGYLAYLGDVNGEEESDRFILAFCGLL